MLRHWASNDQWDTADDELEMMRLAQAAIPYCTWQGSKGTEAQTQAPRSLTQHHKGRPRPSRVFEHSAPSDMRNLSIATREAHPQFRMIKKMKVVNRVPALAPTRSNNRIYHRFWAQQRQSCMSALILRPEWQGFVELGAPLRPHVCATGSGAVPPSKHCAQLQ